MVSSGFVPICTHTHMTKSFTMNGFCGGKMVWYQPINCTHTQMTKSFTMNGFCGGKMVWYQPINCTHTQMTKSFTMNGFCWWEDGMVSTHQLYTHPNDQVIYKWFLLVGRWYGINPSIVHTPKWPSHLQMVFVGGKMVWYQPINCVCCQWLYFVPTRDF